MAAVLITRREATAEASLARRRDLRKLGTAMAAMIRITATTRSNSIKENPLWLRMNTPQACASVGGRGPGRVGAARNPSSESTSSHARDSIPINMAEKAIFLLHRRGHRGDREGDRARRGGSTQLLSPTGAGACVFRAWRGQARDKILGLTRFECVIGRSALAEMERILKKK